MTVNPLTVTKHDLRSFKATIFECMCVGKKASTLVKKTLNPVGYLITLTFLPIYHCRPQCGLVSNLDLYSLYWYFLAPIHSNSFQCFCHDCDFLLFTFPVLF